MKMTKTFLAVAVAVAMAFSIAVTLLTTATTTRRVGGEEDQLAGSSEEDTSKTKTAVQTKWMSLILAQDDYYPRPKYHWNKDNNVCSEEGSPGSTCCNNKCIDIVTDKKNCEAWKNKYKYMESCCNGECVNLSFDKRHCGKCHNKCMQGGYCIYANV